MELTGKGSTMVVEERVLGGLLMLSQVERHFLILLGELGNDLTNLSKLTAAANRKPPDQLEMKANAVLDLVLLKLLSARIWQSWELLRFYKKKVLAQAPWLKGYTSLQDRIKDLKPEFKDGCVWDRIRDKFAYHYDSTVLSVDSGNDVLGDQFELISSGTVVNSFFISSEMAIWSSILGVDDDDGFSVAYPALVSKALDLTFNLVGIIRELFAAFVDHVVGDLGGTWEVKATSVSISAIPYESALLPLFGV